MCGWLFPFFCMAVVSFLHDSRSGIFSLGRWEWMLQKNTAVVDMDWRQVTFYECCLHLIFAFVYLSTHSAAKTCLISLFSSSSSPFPGSSLRHLYYPDNSCSLVVVILSAPKFVFHYISLRTELGSGFLVERVELQDVSWSMLSQTGRGSGQSDLSTITCSSNVSFCSL